MKQVSNAIKSFVQSSPLPQSINQRGILSKYLFVLLLAGFAIVGSSFQKENLMNSSQKQGNRNGCVEFKGKFTIDLTTGVATGVGSHIGRFTSVGQSTIDFAKGTITGTSTTMAANEDKIFTNDMGTITNNGDGTAVAEVHCTIMGGTGRFKEASGSYVNYAILNFETNTADATFDGTICY